jgi:hypothetical protein
MKSLKFFLVFFTVFFLAGCAGSDCFISEDWDEPPASIAVIFTNPIVENMDDVADDLPEYVNSFSTWVTSEFKKYIEANVKSGKEGTKIGVDVVHYPSGRAGGPSSFVMHETELLLEEKDFFAGDNEHMAFPKADVYLIMDCITIKNVDASSSGVGLLGYIMHGGDLFFEATYAFYDGKTHERLGVGTLQASESYFFGVAKSTWEELMENAVEDIFEGTPVFK